MKAIDSFRKKIAGNADFKAGCQFFIREMNEAHASERESFLRSGKPESSAPYARAGESKASLSRRIRYLESLLGKHGIEY